MDGKREKIGHLSGQSHSPLPDFDPPKKPKLNKFALACSFLASMTSVLLGYDIGVMIGAILYIKKELKITEVQKEVLMGIFSLYSIIGSAIAGRTSDRLGRRITIVFAGALLMSLATNYAFLMVGRLISGIGVGHALMIAPVYTAELSPASIRGCLLSLPELFINFGLLIGYVSNLAFSKLPTNLGWRFMLGLGMIPSIFLTAIVLVMPESPRWLVMQGRLADAKRVLDKTSDSSEESELRLAKIKEAAGIPERCTEDVVSVTKKRHGEGVWRELFLRPTPAVRHILLCALGIHFFQMATGIENVVLYSPTIFEKAAIGVMSGAILYIKKDLKITDVQKEVLMGIFSLYSIIGSAIAGRTSDRLGRRITIVFAGVIFFAGALLMSLATNYAFLMVGRLIAGIGVGHALMIAPVYTAELSPASIRGCLLSLPELFINFGLLIGYVSNLAFSKLPTNLGWRFMLGLGMIPSIFLTAIVLVMPESPRWLVMQGRLADAKRVLDKTSGSSEESELRLAEIKEAAGIPEHCIDDVVSVTKKRHGEGVWRELFLRPTPAVRHILLCAMGIHFFQMATGIENVILYSPTIFEKAGVKNDTNRLLATLAVGFVKTIFILFATFFLDKIGRRKLLLTSAGGCCMVPR